MKRSIWLSFVAAAVVATLAGFAASPASASDGNAPVFYVALGDSLATGAQPARSGVLSGLRAANGTNRGYVDVLYGTTRAQIPNLQLRNFGCGGESTTSLIEGGFPFDFPCGYGHTTSQLDEALAFLRAHSGDIAFVTIDIGANDLLAGVGLPVIAANLSLILAAVRDAAGPAVPIVGMNYYDPFVAPIWFATNDVGLVAAEAASVAAFNDFLEGIYAAAGVTVADVEAAFQLQSLTLVDGVPLNVVRACQWTWMCAVGDIHANDDGYAVIAQTFAAALP